MKTKRDGSPLSKQENIAKATSVHGGNTTPFPGQPPGIASTTDGSYNVHGRGNPWRLPWLPSRLSPESSISAPLKSPSLLILLLYSGVLELLFLLIVALSPLPGLHLYSTPLPATWSWTLLPSQLLFPQTWSSPASSVRHDWQHLALLSLTLIASMGIYALAGWNVFRTRKHQQSLTSRWLLILLVGACLFGLTLLFQPALLSDDVFTYIFSGRILTIYHADPLNTAPSQFANDPYMQWVISGRYTQNIYGPLWLYVASILVSLGYGPVGTLLLFKGLALCAHLVNVVLVWAILGKIAPHRRLLCTLLYAWNPLVILELAGSGHSEGLLMTLLLLATLLYVSGNKRWHEIGVLILLGLAMSLNLIALLIAPLLHWFTVRTERSLPHAFWGVCWRMLIGLAVVMPIYLPFWRGASTFFAITSAIDLQHFVRSPIGLLTGPTRWAFGLVDQWSHFPPVMQPTTAADLALRASAIFIFALIYMHLFGTLRNAPSSATTMRSMSESEAIANHPDIDVLLDSWSIAVFWYLVLVMGWFWPWYMLWALWIAVLRRFDGRTIAYLLLSGTALLIYPLLGFTSSSSATYQSIIIFGIPLAYLFIYRGHLRRPSKIAEPADTITKMPE